MRDQFDIKELLKSDNRVIDPVSNNIPTPISNNPLIRSIHTILLFILSKKIKNLSSANADNKNGIAKPAE